MNGGASGSTSLYDRLNIRFSIEALTRFSAYRISINVNHLIHLFCYPTYLRKALYLAENTLSQF
jgi:hypothetical protein